MTDHTLQQFGDELKSFFVLVLLNMSFGALALGFGMQIIIATFLPSASGEPPSLVLSTVRILVGITGMCIGFFWILTSMKILRGIKGIRKGVCPATFASGTTGTATVNATVDDQSVSAVITISAAHGGGHSTGTYYWVNTGNTEEQGYTGPEPTVMGYNPPPVTPAGTPVVAPQSRQVAGSTPVIEQQTVAAPPAASTAPSSGIPVVPAVAALAGIGVIGGGGLLARRWWIQRQNPALFRKYD